MTFDKFHTRLTSLEAITRPADPRPDEAATLASLQTLASDEKVSELYNAALVETGKLRCGHRLFGWCQVCLDAAPAVGVAWMAYRERLKERESKNVVVGQSV